MYAKSQINHITFNVSTSSLLAVLITFVTTPRFKPNDRFRSHLNSSNVSRGIFTVTNDTCDESIAWKQITIGAFKTICTYRVINLDWEKVLSFCSQLLLLTSLEFFFFYSTMFDVFHVKISLVCVKYFVHNINLK